MKICDINPFIRYASMSDFHPLSDFVYSYDCRLFYLIDGECEITLDEKRHIIKKDSLLLWQAGTKYRFEKYDNSKMIVLNFDYTQEHNSHTETISPATAHDFDRDSVLTSEFCENCDIFNRPLVMENMSTVKTQLVSITEKFNTVGIYKNEICSAVLKDILTKIATVSSYSKTKTLNKIDTILEYLLENFDKDITNKDIGELLGYHKNYINRLMLKYTGNTLHRHLMGIRLDIAKNLLTQSDIPIYEIAEKCGFKNAAYFSNHFKSKHSISPSEYRSKYKYLI